MKEMKNYEQQVYAGVLGKVIGVYMGRPVEGWSMEKIMDRFGVIDRYVHEDIGVPLVAADDDISGTFTFIKALEDSGLYGDTPPEFFGDTWLNYLIENQTVLWWGGMGISTEHTAYLRLKEGYKSPESGSTKLNGRNVSEQIGAQIFIDAAGMVAPGKPELAVSLADRMARVSHDGEAVHAAKVVAAMVSAAFIEKNMDKLLDIGISFIPKCSLIAQVHRDVRQWSKKDKCWRKTYDRIRKKYGYDKFCGNCHVIPNHAIMVMAWCHAPDDFYESQLIINSAGWDTDCNAANVGSIMGIKVGLERINERYDFYTPFAGRVVIPNADGSGSITDCAAITKHIANIGRRTMGWKCPPKDNTCLSHNFPLPGAMHGYMSEDSYYEYRGAAQVSATQFDYNKNKGGLLISFNTGPGRTARISTPVNADPLKSNNDYRLASTPTIYPGMTVKIAGKIENATGKANLRLFFRSAFNDKQIFRSKPVRLKTGGKIDLSFTAPTGNGLLFKDMGIEISSNELSDGTVTITEIIADGSPELCFRKELPHVTLSNGNAFRSGWLSSMDGLPDRIRNTQKESYFFMNKNSGVGVQVTGNRSWRDCSISAKLYLHMADRLGLVVRYQGLERYIAACLEGEKIKLILRNYGKETILASKKIKWDTTTVKQMRVDCRGKDINVFIDGEKILSAKDKYYGCGGAGLYISTGCSGFRELKIHG